jgi:copper chaperone NosL
MYNRLISFIFFATLLFAGCGTDPEPINYGHDECEFCRMLITDNRYGAELITDKRKVFKFDAIECMVEYALVKNLIGDVNQKFLVTDFSLPENFTEATTAFYVKNEKYRSPMGLNVTAFGDHITGQKFVSENGGTALDWIEVIQLVKQRSL